MARRRLITVPASQEVVLATGNAGKLRELQCLLGEAYRLIPQSELKVTPVEESGTTFEENALLKARHAAQVTGLPAIADDSGLEVDALDGAPGVWSARFAGPDADDEANNTLLLHRLKDVQSADRSARFRCVVVYVSSAEDRYPLIASGAWEGRIASVPAGENGFGYDPIFVDVGSGRSSAELSPGVKNQLSHRGKAVRRLCAMLDRPAAEAKLD